ncbi:SixA phosphatase family protein [Actinokineospora guangxiensis]|uniref:SixA phosphatase family protein n=1 Tax=Actinokineospora guangxiensis TaxID=1490288 RepID=A0ABW0EI57_9PSEU
MDDSARWLVIVRHAKSTRPELAEDGVRPLAERGERDAAVAGRWLQQNASTLDLAVCSPAVRARQTWERAALELAEPPHVSYDRRLYSNSQEALWDLARTLPRSARAVALIGHNPELEDFVSLATGAPRQLKTSAIAVLSVATAWADLAPGAASVAALVVPRHGP